MYVCVYVCHFAQKQFNMKFGSHDDREKSWCAGWFSIDKVRYEGQAV